jgi:hypothetical protein
MAKLMHTKLSDKFWRMNMMKLLECLEFQELTWSKQNWQDYGISNADARKIEAEYKRYASRPLN